MGVELARVRQLHRPSGIGDVAGFPVNCIRGGGDRAMDGEEESGKPPRPIGDGLVDQSIVEYMGNKMGTFTCRPSGREYRFSASPRDKRKYVPDEDLEYFRRRPDFRVLEEGRIDREADERKKRETQFAELHAQLQQHERREAELEAVVTTLAHDQGGPRRRGKRTPGGRPPVPLTKLQELWHLRHHNLPPCSLENLASRFLTEDYATPRATMSTRLSRFKKAHPELTVEERCPWCRADDESSPPTGP